jgi:hypothetical protein
MDKSLGKRLADTKIGMNDQLPQEIAEQCKKTLPKVNRLKGKSVVIVVYILYSEYQPL